jgi:hypothetical protein
MPLYRQGRPNRAKALIVLSAFSLVRSRCPEPVQNGSVYLHHRVAAHDQIPDYRPPSSLYEIVVVGIHLHGCLAERPAAVTFPTRRKQWSESPSLRQNAKSNSRSASCWWVSREPCHKLAFGHQSLLSARRQAVAQRQRVDRARPPLRRSRAIAFNFAKPVLILPDLVLWREVFDLRATRCYK